MEPSEYRWVIPPLKYHISSDVTRGAEDGLATWRRVKGVLERFKELLSKNPEKYVLMTETGEELAPSEEVQV